MPLQQPAQVGRWPLAVHVIRGQHVLLKQLLLQHSPSVAQLPKSTVHVEPHTPAALHWPEQHPAQHGPVHAVQSAPSGKHCSSGQHVPPAQEELQQSVLVAHATPMGQQPPAHGPGAHNIDDGSQNPQQQSAPAMHGAPFGSHTGASGTFASGTLASSTLATPC